MGIKNLNVIREGTKKGNIGLVLRVQFLEIANINDDPTVAERCLTESIIRKQQINVIHRRPVFSGQALCRGLQAIL